jgi:hypothetical protein
MHDRQPTDHAVLRLWSFTDAPSEYQRAFPDMRGDYWVVYVPRDLMQQDVLALLQLNSISHVMTRVVRLPDGGALLAGPFLGPAPDPHPKGAAHQKPVRARAAAQG